MRKIEYAVPSGILDLPKEIGITKSMRKKQIIDLVDKYSESAEKHLEHQAFANAFVCLSKALDISKSIKDGNTEQRALINFNFAKYYASQKKYSEAARYGLVALSIIERLKSVRHQFLTDCIIHTGDNILKSEQDTQFIPFCERALTVLDEHFPKMMFDADSIINQLSHNQLRKVDTREAIQITFRYYNRVYELQQKFNKNNASQVINVRQTMIQMYDYFHLIEMTIPLHEDEINSWKILEGPGSSKLFEERMQLYGKLTLLGFKDQVTDLFLQISRDLTEAKNVESIMAEHQMSSIFYNMRARAFSCLHSKQYAQAEELYKFLLHCKYHYPGTCCHLSRLYILTGQKELARSFIQKAFQQKDEAPPYVLGRIYFFRILVAMLNQQDFDEDYWALKEILRDQNAYWTWTIDPLLKEVEKSLEPEYYKVLQGLSDRINR